MTAIKGQSHDTGDVLLAAALMSFGIPPDPIKPVSVMHRDDGKTYGRFHMGPKAIDGSETTASLMRWWTNPHETPQGHLWGDLMVFIKNFRGQARDSRDWFEAAHSFLGRKDARPIDAPVNLTACNDFVQRHPNDLAGHVFAFPANRETLFLLYKSAVPDILLSKGSAHSKVSANAPKHVQNELLGRLK